MQDYHKWHAYSEIGVSNIERNDKNEKNVRCVHWLLMFERLHNFHLRFSSNEKAQGSLQLVRNRETDAIIQIWDGKEASLAHRM